MSSSSSTPQNEIKGHQGNPGHRLVLSKDAIIQRCNSCLDRIDGVGLSFKCIDCKDDHKSYFHEACLNPNKKLLYPFSNSQVVLTHYDRNTTEEYMKKKSKLECVACRCPVKGSRYSDCSSYELHPNCVLYLLASSAVEKAFPENYKRLQVECCPQLPRNTKCKMCKKDDAAGGYSKGWCYVVKKGDNSEEMGSSYHISCLKMDFFNKYLGSAYAQIPQADRRLYFSKRQNIEMEMWRKTISPYISAIIGQLLPLTPLAPVAPIISPFVKYGLK